MGQFGSNLTNPDVMNPNEAKWGDLSGGEKGARLFGGATRGLTSGLQNYFQQGQAMRGPGGFGQINPMMTQQPVSPDYFQPQRRGQNNLSFYGGG